MGNLTIATMFIVMVNVLMWFGSIAMLDVNPSGTSRYNLEGSIIDSATTRSGDTTLVDNDITNQLPSNEDVSTDSGNVFTDIFTNILGWFKDIPGLKYIYGIVAAPYNILNGMGLPGQFVAGIGTLWYLVSFLVLIAFIWGRD
jgi:hypothetical protein